MSAVAALAITASNDIANAETPKDNCFGCADERTIWTRIWQGVALTSVGVNVAAMVTEASAVAIIAGLVACLIAPVVIYLQFQLQDTESTYSCVIVILSISNAHAQCCNLCTHTLTHSLTPRVHTESTALRTVQNELRNEVNRLHLENDKLSSEVTQLETQVGRYGRTNIDCLNHSTCVRGCFF